MLDGSFIAVIEQLRSIQSLQTTRRAWNALVSQEDGLVGEVEVLIASKTRLVDGKRGHMAPIVLSEAEEADEEDVGDIREMCECPVIFCFILALFLLIAQMCILIF